jgi:hypothetical protein
MTLESAFNVMVKLSSPEPAAHSPVGKCFTVAVFVGRWLRCFRNLANGSGQWSVARCDCCCYLRVRPPWRSQLECETTTGEYLRDGVMLPEQEFLSGAATPSVAAGSCALQLPHLRVLSPLSEGGANPSTRDILRTACSRPDVSKTLAVATLRQINLR